MNQDKEKSQFKEILCYPKHLLMSGKDDMFSFEELKSISYRQTFYEQKIQKFVDTNILYKKYTEEEIKKFDEERKQFNDKKQRILENLYVEIDEYIKYKIMEGKNVNNAASKLEIDLKNKSPFQQMEDIESDIFQAFETKINTIINMEFREFAILSPENFYDRIGLNNKVVWHKDITNEEKNYQLPKISTGSIISQNVIHKKAMLSVIYETSTESSDQSNSIPLDSSKAIGQSLNSTSSTSTNSTNISIK